jgi:2-polyprenyl-3-methyl-5-hydroxy-6-metoxy-1,4-benzoquinol methylase
MYGSEKLDPLVKYYDQTLAMGSRAELEWYLDKVKRYGDPVLDMACGTGRLSLLLLEHGFSVTAMDQSEGMLNQFKKKLARSDPALRNRVKILHEEMSGFNLGWKFNTVLCCDAFFHNLTVEDEIACLESVAQHLTPDGRFLFNLPNPTCEFILAASKTEGRTFGRAEKYPLANNSGHITVERLEQHLADQSIETTLRFTVYDQKENILEQSESSWKSRYLFKYEAIHLLYRCGFEVESLVGGYQNQPIGDNGQLIFQAKLQD